MMARREGFLAGRLHFEAELIAEVPLHVGGEALDPDTDLPLARDGRGVVHVPGTSLSGALRDALPPVPREDVFWGAGRDDADARRGGLVWVRDARVRLTQGAAPELRDGVAIDRVWGVAADGFKFDRMVLPPGTRLDLRLTIDLPHGDAAAEDEAVGLLGALVATARAGTLRLGAAQTRGLGVLSMAEGWHVRREDAASRSGMIARLRGAAGAADTGLRARVEAAAKSCVPPKRLLRVEIAWQPTSPVMVKAAGEGAKGAVTMLPLTVRARDAAPNRERRFVLPGSALKGAFRSHAERVERTCGGINAPESDFLAQLRTAPLAIELFGAGGPKAREERSVKGPAWQPGRGAVAVSDCLAETTIGAAALDGLATDTPQNWIRAGGGGLREGLDIAYHNAVDRWTGGAADAFLFSAAEPRVAWAPIRLAVDLDRLSQANRAAALALLMMVLRDLAEGWMTIGFGGNRGYGEVKVTGVTVTGSDPRGVLQGLAPRFAWSPERGWEATDPGLDVWLTKGWKPVSPRASTS